MGIALAVLIVDDSEDDALLLLRELTKGGYDPTWERVDSAEAMQSTLARQPWDVVISDYNIPGFGAAAALAVLRETDLDLPFIVVSGAIGEETAVEMMRAGAHDFVMKDNLARLVPALERELREATVRRERRQVQEQLEHSFIDLAETVSRAMDSRDPYTAGHQRRVAELARFVGEKLGVAEPRLTGLYIGGLLHDIGKIATPEVILNKLGKLLEEEWNLLRAHTKRGYEILKDSNLPWPVADMALHHHERLDGSGYPEGLTADQLSLEVRILSVCDVAEAMVSHRPYRPARSKAEVLEELRGGCGTKYDAAVVEIIVSLIEKEAPPLF